jgi:S-adenosylmethionine-diacylglycerol 3-amino-3-carboxypropyl transferase
VATTNIGDETREFARAADLAEVRYSQVWEDHRVLERALDIGLDDTVLSITSGGCNTLALALAGARRVVAVDISGAQSALLELKIAAARALDYEQFVAFLGARDCGRRLILYPKVRQLLTTEGRAFWDARRSLVSAGVIGCGRLERYLSGFSGGILERHGLGAAARTLMELDDLPDQRGLFARNFTDRAFVNDFHRYFARAALSDGARHRSQFRYVGEIDVAAYLWGRFRHACTELPARGNFYLEYMLTGRYRDLEIGPPYLRRSCFEALRAVVDRIEVVTAEVGELLDLHVRARFDKANLSNVLEYLSEERAHELLTRLAEHMQPGGRIAYWNLLVPRQAPPQSSLLHPLDAEARALREADRGFIYSDFRLDRVADP